MRKSKYRDLQLGLLMYLLLLPEFILFVTVGTETILKSYLAVAAFFGCTILLYTAVPLLVERRFPLEARRKSSIKSGFQAIILAVFVLALKMVLMKQETPKFIEEYTNFVQTSGAVGFVGATLQHLYYFAEMILCCYMLRTFQKAGETIFGEKPVPYGGIALGILWGLIVHTISKGISVGIYMLVLSVLWGIIYLISQKNRWLTYVLMAILFIT